jgi:hypothetical protein
MPPTPKRRENHYERAVITPVHSIQQGTPTNAPNKIVYLCSRSRYDIKHEIGWNASVLLAIPSLSTSSRYADEQDLQTSFDDLLSLNGFENIGEPPNIHPRNRSVHDVESRWSLPSSSENTIQYAAASSLNGFYPISEEEENFQFIGLYLIHSLATTIIMHKK